MASGISPKAPHYVSGLTAALLRGDWNSASAGKAPNGTELDWPELIRKWGKHTGGNTALIHQLRNICLIYDAPTSNPSAAPGHVTCAHENGYLEPSAPTGREASISGPPATNGGHSPSRHFSLKKHKSKASLRGGDNLTLTTSLSNTSPVTSPFKVREELEALSSSPADADDATEDDAWIDGTSWWSGVDLRRVDNVESGIKELKAMLKGDKSSSGDAQSARIILAQHLSAVGRHQEALKQLDALNASLDVMIGVLDGDAAIMDRIRAACLRGVALELQPSSSPSAAVEAYSSVAPLLNRLTSLPSISSANVWTSKSSPKIPFDTHREVHRWISTSLSRSAILSAQRPNSLQETLRSLRTYHIYSRSWPSHFRPVQQHRMLFLYLRALHAAYPASALPCPTPYLLDPSLPSPTAPARSVWHDEVVSAFQHGQLLLNATTSFPKAGFVNAPVVAFVDLCVALADRQPTLNHKVIDILYWAMTKTFQSQSILRHITRLLVSVGDAKTAQKMFETYVKLVLKSRETQQPEVSLQLKRRPTEDTAAAPKDIEKQASVAEDGDGPKAEQRKDQVAEVEIDSDEDFLQALLVGSRLLIRDIGDANEAWRYVYLAGEVIENADKRGTAWIKDATRGEVEEAKGVVRMAMGTRGAGGASRSTYQAQSLNHLTSATELNPSSPSTYYHLAYCQAEARSIQSAIDAVHRALELDARNIQFWHLSALLMTAQGDWKRAAKAGEAGLLVWEQEEERELQDEQPNVIPNPGESEPTVEAKDFADKPGTNGTTGAVQSEDAEPLLFPNGAYKPAKILTVPIYPPPVTRVVRLEQVISLRITLNVIAEKLHGQTYAMTQHRELFAFFFARSGSNRGDAAAVGRGMPGSVSTISFGQDGTQGNGLSGSFVNLNLDSDVGIHQAEPSFLKPQTPTPMTTASRSDSPRSVSGPGIVPSTQSSGTMTPSLSEPDMSRKAGNDPTILVTAPRDGRRIVSGAKSLSNTKRLMAKHLHVPHPNKSRPSSIRRMSTNENLNMSGLGAAASRLTPPSALSYGQNRSASTSSTAISLAPTAVHSHFHGSPGHRASSIAPPGKAPDHGRTAAESRILSDLWLMSAATFRRAGELDQCLVAIGEAELLDPSNSSVWIQLGLYYQVIAPPALDRARDSLQKAILLRPDHPGGLICLADLYLLMGQVDLAHNVLNQVTQDSGWDEDAAWFVLAEACQKQGRKERAEECLIYALDLAKTAPARRLSEAVDRCL